MAFDLALTFIVFVILTQIECVASYSHHEDEPTRGSASGDAHANSAIAPKCVADHVVASGEQIVLIPSES